jgi:hypothetical protein
MIANVIKKLIIANETKVLSALFLVFLDKVLRIKTK